MKGIQRFPKTFVLAGVVLAGTFGMAIIAAAQDVPDLQTPKSPLVLKDEGSFFVGGEVKAVEKKATESKPVQASEAKPANKRVVRKRETDEQKARRIAAKYGISW